MERLDALSVRESNGKSYFTKIGAAFPNKDGKGYSVVLDCMPAPVDGQFKVMLRVPLPKDGERQQRQSTASDNSGWGNGNDLDDEIPF